MGTTDGEELDVRVDRGAHRRGTRAATLPGAGPAPGSHGAGRASGLLAALVTAVALLLAGCADSGSAGGTGDPTGSPPSGGDQTDSSSGDQLGGRTFLSTSVTGHDLAAGSGISLAFGDDGTITAGAGCNTMSGTYRLTDGTLAVSEMAQTEMGCDQDLMDQDTWFAGLLAAGLTVDLQGDVLTLTAKGVTMQLTDRRVVDPDRPLEGTTWIVDGIITGTGPDGAVSSVPQGITATMRIADGKIHFFDGLNGYDGPEDPDGTITIGPESVQVHGDFAGGGAGCASGATCSVDMSLLTHDFNYQITAGRLTVTGTGQYAGHGLMLTARDAGATNSGTASAQEPPTPTGAPESPKPSGEVPPGDVTSAPTASGPVSGSVTPAQPAPTVSPGAASELTSTVGPRRTPGRHDSIPPQPSPAGQPDT